MENALVDRSDLEVCIDLCSKYVSTYEDCEEYCEKVGEDWKVVADDEEDC